MSKKANCLRSRILHNLQKPGVNLTRIGEFQAISGRAAVNLGNILKTRKVVGRS
jgi:hypothetical protein